MTALNLLFICSRNLWRSPTAEKIYQRDPRFNVRSCGISPSAKRRLTSADLAWADIVFVMERRHRSRILERFGDQLGETPGETPGEIPIHILDIPDEYQFMDPELVELLVDRVEQFLSAPGSSDSR